MKMGSKEILNAVQLPTLSQTLLQIIAAEKRYSISFTGDIEQIVEKDPLLPAHIIKTANSAFYGFSQEVHTLSQAIGLLGAGKTKNLALSFSIFDFIKHLDYKPIYGNVFHSVLKKSLLISASAVLLAQKTGYPDKEELYISGLLAEIGELILFLFSPDKYGKIHTVHDKKLIPLERKIFQTDHVVLGLDFCLHFHLPAYFNIAIKNHYQLQEADESSKISFIANQIAEFLLAENKKEKSVIFKDLENYSKKLLHLSIPGIEETVRQLPGTMAALVPGFPEMQKDLENIVRTGSASLLSLVKKELEMTALTRELTDSRQKMAREKIFLSHMLNLSYFFSSLMPPLQIISSLFEYFENFIREFTIRFIYNELETGNYISIESKEESGGTPIDIRQFSSLIKAKILNEAVRLESNEMERMGKSPSIVALVFPISYHANFFGFLILDVEERNYLEFDLEMTYMQILANIIANSFQNYRSFQTMRSEADKKKLVTRELLKFGEELNQSREIVIALQKAGIMGELLPVIFHKLKNKLTPILGYAQILLAKVKEPAINERIKKIEKNALELTNQLNMLRDYFRTEGVTKEKENLNHIIARLKPHFDNLEKNHQVRITVDTDYAVPDDFLNPGQIETLIANILDNAVVAVREKDKNGGIIIIKTESLPGGYRLTVRDNGIGIKEQNLYHIWAPFYTDYPDHSGIGLAVCEKIIANHSATYTVQSKEGEFTEFAITFKRTLAEEKESPAPELPLRRKDLRGKILIVDDEAYLLDLMKEILLNEGDFEIVTTTSGKEAIRLIDENFDLVISDIRMPEVNGMDIYDFLSSKQMQSRVIMVTADPFSEDVARFLEKNRIKYLKKPFELIKFKQIILEKLSK